MVRHRQHEVARLPDQGDRPIDGQDEQQGQHRAHEDGQAAQARDRMGVDVAAAGRRHRPEPAGDPVHLVRDGVGHQERDDPGDEVGREAHESLSARTTRSRSGLRGCGGWLRP